MLRLTNEQLSAAAPLFAGTEETMVWSCLQGCMGEAYAPTAVVPACAQLVLGDFCFYGGDSAAPGAVELARHIPRWLLAVPPDAGWEALLEREHPGRCERLLRYATKKEPDAFDRERLTALAASLPPAYRLAPIDERLYAWTLTAPWAKDLCGQFADAADYRRRGRGYLVLRGEEPVCGASSYAVYRGGIEIEIDTHPAYRRRGLATACAARLLLACLDEGLYPSWDAATPASLALAEKLGYHAGEPYVTYAIRPV